MPFLLFIAFFCLGIALRHGALMDPDTGWHIAAGDLIRETGALPETDPWSHTAGDHVWYNISWAYDVALSFIHQAGGLSSVVIFSVTLYALAVAGMGAVALKSSKSIIAALLTTTLLGFVLLPGMLARPQGVSFLLILGAYAVLRFGGTRSLWLLPILTVLWANIHGSFLIIFVMLAAFFAEAIAGGRSPRAIRLAGAGVFCAGAVLLNPYGAEIIEAVRMTMGSAMKDVLMEWRPAALQGVSAVTLFLAFFVLVSALFKRSIPLADKLLACFWLAMGLSSMRMMQVAALLSAPYLAQGLALRLRQAPFGRMIEQKDESYGKDLARPVVTGVLSIMCALLAVSAFAPAVQRTVAGNAKDFVSFPSRHTPDGALDFIARELPGIRIYNTYDFGGYMIYRERGATPVFVDGRADTAYPREVLADAVVLGSMRSWRIGRRSAPEDWAEVADKYRLDGFLIRPRGRRYEALRASADWKRVYCDETAVIFMRADDEKALSKRDICTLPSL